ncbi:ABC transporter permease [Dactylosporangium sp. NPDC050688]|uniref:ABC transporter permease n=1 Tax=Dactylosporangium sp. NPDC050688 TaxID=3157217 RepID=UPI003405C9FA
MILFIAAWDLYVVITDMSKFVLPRPKEVAVAFGEQITTPYVWTGHIWTTFYEIVFGLLLACVLGIPLGFFIGKWELLERMTRPFLVASQVVPMIALIPLFLLWFGFGSFSKVVIAALSAFFPFLINTAFGVRSIPKSLNELMVSLKASQWERFRKLELPYTLAYTMAGAQLAIVTATIGVIVGQYLGGNEGLGRYLVMLQNDLQIARVFGAIIMIALLGFLLYSAIIAVNRVLVPWHDSVRSSRR